MSENSSSPRLAISELDDDPKIRKNYRPFILSDEITSNDWISQLELSTVEAMVENVLEQSDGRRLRILALHGSLRARSYSRLLLLECSRILFRLGCDVRVFDPTELPMKDESHEDHPKVQELRSLSEWSDGHLWVSPEQHGTIPAVFKNQIDWIPLSVGSIRPTQGRTLAIAQVCGGSQSFNTVNALRILGRWMRMFTIPNQSSVPKAYTQFTASIDDSDPAAEQPTDGGNRMIPSSNRDRVVDCMEELVKYTLVMRPHFALFSDRFSERSEKAKKSNGAKVNGATSSDNTTNGVDIKSI